MPARLLSVNVGRPKQGLWPDKPRVTAIDKRPVDGPVDVHPLGIDGDQVGDVSCHGGVDMAVYAFAREDLDVWAERLGRPIRNGMFGENLTTVGIDINEALIGERWTIGTATFQISEVRIPCNTFKRWIAAGGFDDTAWVKRFTREARPGPYLRVVGSGRISPGDEITVVSKPDHNISVTTMFRALTTERELIPRLFELGDAMSTSVREVAEAYAAHF